MFLIEVEVTPFAHWIPPSLVYVRKVPTIVPWLSHAINVFFFVEIVQIHAIMPTSLKKKEK